MPNSILNHEQVFATAFKKAPEGRALRAHDGKSLKVNEALCTLFECSETELLTRSFHDTIDPIDQQSSVTFFEQIMNQKTHSTKIGLRYLHDDGNLFWIHISASLVIDEENMDHYFITHITQAAKYDH